MYVAGQPFGFMPTHLADPYSGYDAVNLPDPTYSVTVWDTPLETAKAPFPWLWVAVGLAALLLLSNENS